MPCSLQIEVWEEEGNKSKEKREAEWQQHHCSMQSQGLQTVRTDILCWTIISNLRNGSGGRILQMVI